MPRDIFTPISAFAAQPGTVAVFRDGHREPIIGWAVCRVDWYDRHGLCSELDPPEPDPGQHIVTVMPTRQPNRVVGLSLWRMRNTLEPVVGPDDWHELHHYEGPGFEAVDGPTPDEIAKWIEGEQKAKQETSDA